MSTCGLLARSMRRLLATADSDAICVVAQWGSGICRVRGPGGLCDVAEEILSPLLRSRWRTFPVPRIARVLAGGLNGEPRLANAARSRQAEQSRRGELLTDVYQLALATDEAIKLQRRMRRRDGRRLAAGRRMIRNRRPRFCAFQTRQPPFDVLGVDRMQFAAFPASDRICAHAYARRQLSLSQTECLAAQAQVGG